MKYYLSIDDNGYLQSVFSSESEIEAPHIESLDGYDFSGNRIGAYRWDGDKLVIDENRLKELDGEEQQSENDQAILDLTDRLRNSDSVVLEALEGLFEANTITGFISALINAAKDIKSTLSERNELRERIRELRGD